MIFLKPVFMHSYTTHCWVFYLCFKTLFFISLFFFLQFYVIKIGKQISVTSLSLSLSESGRNQRRRHLCLQLLCCAEEAHSACLTCCRHALDLWYATNLFVIAGVGRVIFLCVCSQSNAAKTIRIEPWQKLQEKSPLLARCWRVRDNKIDLPSWSTTKFG